GRASRGAGGHGRRGGGRRLRGSVLVPEAGDRAGRARDPLALHLELPQVARHDLRRQRGLREGRGRDDRRQVPGPGLRVRRARARPAGGRRGDQRHRRVLPHLVLLLRRQGPDLHLRHQPAVRAQQPHADRLDVRGGGHGPPERVLRQVQHPRHPAGQHRLPDGRLVPQGDQDHDRPGRPQDAHRRLRRKDRRQAGHGAAADRGRRHLCGAREGHDRRGRVDRALRRREARLLQGRQVLLLSRLVGGRPRPRPVREQGEVGRAAGLLPEDRAQRGGAGARHHAGALRQAQPPGVEAAGRQRRAAAAVLAGDHGHLLQGGAGGLRRARRPERRLQEDLRPHGGVPRRAVPVVAGRRVQHGRLHDPQPRQGL
ncbi:MAG: TRAP transporter solute receptor, unknown substrate 6, partial [uncultured Thermomicrobiales bacterium]